MQCIPSKLGITSRFSFIKIRMAIKTELEKLMGTKYKGKLKSSKFEVIPHKHIN